MFPLPKKGKSEERNRVANPSPKASANPGGAKPSLDTAQKSSDEEMLAAAIEIERSSRLKKVQEYQI